MLLNKIEIPHRRLLIRPGAIGDFIVSLPALEHAAGTAYTEIWTSETNLPLARFAHAKRSIIASGLDRLGLLPADDVIARLRQFDSIVSWYGTNRPDFRELIVGAGLPFEFLPALPLTHPVGQTIVLCGLPGGGAVASEAGGIMHAVDYYCAQVGAPSGAIPHIDVGPVEHHNSVILHPFASRQDKRWPHACATDFSLSGVNLIKLRGPEEQLPGAVYIPDLFDLARFLAGARAYIGNDSGITHLAAAVGVPTIALFGPTDPAIWSPRGRLVKIIQAPQMSPIPPEAVIAALAEFGIY